jgi:hypothetical protein
MTKEEARKELLETLEEYCHDKDYNLQVFAGMANWVYTLYPLQKTITNREKTINNISALNDDDFTKLFCEMSNCTSCPGKPLGEECHERLMEWLKQEAGND